MNKGWITYNAEDLFKLLSAIPAEERPRYHLAIAVGAKGNRRQVFSTHLLFERGTGKRILLLKGESGRTPKKANPIWEKIVKAEWEGAHPYGSDNPKREEQ